MQPRLLLSRVSSRTRAVAALAAAGTAWGTTVPLSKVALAWLPPAWLVVVRFAVAAAVLLAVVDAAALRAALRWPVLAWGAAGFGGSVMVQNAGIDKTSVTHAALLIGTAPVLVAMIAAAWGRSVARPVAWAGFAVSLGGVAVVASGHGGGATGTGDAIVFASVLLSAAVTVAQGRLLKGQDPVALTAVLFLGAAIAGLPVAAVTEGAPPAPPSVLSVAAVVGLTAVGTLGAFTLFAYGQHKVSTEVAGAFLNLEPLVGALAGVAAFGDPAGPRLLIGGAAILGGIAMSALTALRGSGRDTAAAGRLTGSQPVLAGCDVRPLRARHGSAVTEPSATYGRGLITARQSAAIGDPGSTEEISNGYTTTCDNESFADSS